MCTYCMIGDWAFRHNPPWPNQPANPWPNQPANPLNPFPIYPPYNPLLPLPVDPSKPIVPWDIQRLREFEDLLRRVKELEDKLGCPCEPNKADYLQLLKDRIEVLEKKAAER